MTTLSSDSTRNSLTVPKSARPLRGGFARHVNSVSGFLYFSGMSQLEQLTDIVRENREEIDALKSRVRELESKGNVYGVKPPKSARVVDINSKTRQF